MMMGERCEYRMIKEIIVVEGKDDTAAVKRAVEAETIETGGSAINAEIIGRIRLAQQRRGVIVLTDPDHAGERLRRIITAEVPGCKHAFIDQTDATYKDDIGVENASPEVIRRALEQVKTDLSRTSSHIAWDDLLEAGLVAHPAAADRRMKMGRLLGIGYGNGKHFYKRCMMFQVTKDEFDAAWKQMEQQ